MAEQVYTDTMVADFGSKRGGHLYEPLFSILLQPSFHLETV